MGDNKRDSQQMIKQYFPHWEKYLNVPTHLSNKALLQADSFLQTWQSRLQKPSLPCDDDEIDIGVAELEIKPINDEVDHQVSSALGHF